MAGQISQATAIPQRYTGWYWDTGTGRQNVTSAAFSVGQGLQAAYDDRRLRWRLTWMGSHRSETSNMDGARNAQGIAAEASKRLGRFTHTAGLQVSRPGLYFGDQRLYGGDRAAFWRVDYSALRWSAGLGVDYERALATDAYAAYRRTGISGNLQYQLNRNSSVGGTLNLARGSYGWLGMPSATGRQHSFYGYAFYQTRFHQWPRSRFSVTVQRNEQVVLGSSTATGRQLQWEQDWLRTDDAEVLHHEFSTTLGYAWDRSSGITRRSPTAGVHFRYWFNDRSFVGGNLNYISAHSGLASYRGLAGMLNAEYKLAHDWRLGALVSVNQARSAVGMLPGPGGPQSFRTRERYGYVYLRWEASAGAPYQVMGQSLGSSSGTGRILGRVFTDVNGDGIQQTGETGVAGVEVVLDGTYRTRTDSEGRFEFPVVAAGSQQLVITLDTVPLPWGLQQNKPLNVQVPLRGMVDVPVPLQRIRP